MSGNPSYPDWLAIAVDRLAETVAASDPAAPVPPCPGWTVSSLVEHVVAIHRWVIHVLETGTAHPGESATAPTADAAALAAWYRGEAAVMQRLMAEADPDAPCWNFAHVNETAAFWPRRQTHEVTVHTSDALSASGAELAIDPAIAADGIDELFRVFGVRMAARGQPALLAASVIVAPSDADAAWTLGPAAQPGGPVTVSQRREGSAAAEVRGTASDLLLVLWKRLPVDRITVDGDADVAHAFLDSPLSP